MIGDDGVIVRLEVEQMKHQTMHYFAHHQVRVEERVKAEIEKAIANFDWQRSISLQIEQQLDCAIRQMAKQEIDRMLQTEVIQKQIYRLAIKSLKLKQEINHG